MHYADGQCDIATEEQRREFSIDADASTGSWQWAATRRDISSHNCSS